MANIREVAQKAGVSVATVSRVLNHPETVSERTKKHVLHHMKQMDYSPNNLARGLALNKSYSIALLIPNILNPLYPEVAKGVEDVAHTQGYNLLLCNTEEDAEKEKEYLTLLMNRRVDGCIVTSSLLSVRELNELRRETIPIVMIGRSRKAQGVHCVFTDFKEGGHIATNYLIEIGYRKIAHIKGKTNNRESEDKYQGYLQALSENDIPFDSSLVIQGDNEVEGGYLAAKRLIQNGVNPDAVFAANDLMAMGALDALKTEGIKVPEEIAIIGFDNIKMSSLVEPKLTTIGNPVYKMGLIAARLLFDTLERSEDHFVQEIYLKPKLIVRKSCGHEDRIREIFS